MYIYVSHMCVYDQGFDTDLKNRNQIRRTEYLNRLG